MSEYVELLTDIERVSVEARVGLVPD